MAKAVYVCVRNGSTSHVENFRSAINKISRRICPDNITPRPAQIIEYAGVVAGIFSPSGTESDPLANICLGHLTDYSNWRTPGQPAPEGTFVIFRADERTLEVLTDAVGSRSAWYYIDEEILIAGTSQRAIVALLRRFEFNTELIPWMLVTGTPGPAAAWDSRIRRIGADTTLILNRETWNLSLKSGEVSFSDKNLCEMESRESLRDCLQSTVGKMQFDYSKWVLTLSGGYDSRRLLYLLPNPSDIKTITWGHESSLGQKGNDATIARDVAKAMGTTHRYIPIDVSDEPIETLFHRFIVCGEGGIDHIAGYMDGFALWKDLHDSNIEGVIRGDTFFASIQLKSTSDVLYGLGLAKWADYDNLPPAESCGITELDYPESFARRAEESLAQWWDRLRQCYRIPVRLAALSELKTHFVEIANPFLVRRIVDHHTTIPDRFRTERKLFKSLFDDDPADNPASSKIPFARYDSMSKPESILGSAAAVTFLRSVLLSESAHTLFPKPLLKLVGDNLRQYKIQDHILKRPIMNFIDAYVSSAIRKRIKSMLPSRPEPLMMNFNMMAFRIYMICAMHKLLSEDEKLL